MDRSLKYWKGFSFLMVALNIAVLLFVLLRPAPQVQQGPPGPGEEEHGPAKFIIEKLQFTRDQEMAFNELKRAHHDSVMALQREGRRLREAFFAGLQSDTTFAAREDLVRQIADNQRQIELVTYDHFAAVKQLCNPQQKVIFNQIIGEVLRRMAPPMPPHERRPDER